MPFLLTGLFAIYAITACPTVYPGDSGELIAAAFSLGIPHNSGYPLYALVGKAASLLPLGSLGYRVNLFSSLTVALAIALLYLVIWEWTRSRTISLSAALFLAFTEKVWSQSASAEVYGLHLFFMVLLLWFLFRWDREKAWWWLALLAFSAGLSFGNHLQTVMLAPGILYLVISRDRTALLKPSKLLVIASLFCFPLMLYGYLPIRTLAGAAITWGDPDTWERFVAHVTATSHRHGYVFNQPLQEYASRAGQAIVEIWRAFGPLLILAFWGWWRIRESRWKALFLLIIVFDLTYTIFLNTISLKITSFSTPTCIVLIMMMGMGIYHAWSSVRSRVSSWASMDRLIRVSLCALPVIPLASNLDRCNQGWNYIAYEHAVNIFRTLDPGDTLVMCGDNHVFPVAYGRIVERMREDVRLYDRHNTIFKLPGMTGAGHSESRDWDFSRKKAEQLILDSKGKGTNVYYAVFFPHSETLPKGTILASAGILHKAIPDQHGNVRALAFDLWGYYTWKSMQETFPRDYMTREICAFYYFSKGKHFFRTDRPFRGLAFFELASGIGYDDKSIHSEMGVFLTTQGHYEAARRELEIANIHHESMHVVHNNWGYYYHKIGEYEKAAASFREALKLRPDSVVDFNSLGFSLYEMGKEEEAIAAFKKSLSIDPEQPEISRFVKRIVIRRLKGG